MNAASPPTEEMNKDDPKGVRESLVWIKDNITHVASQCSAYITNKNWSALKLNIKTPSDKAKISHHQILKKICKKTNIQPSEEGPIVLTVLIATRAKDDIEKSMRDAYLSDEDYGRTILLRIVPTPPWEA